MLILTVEHSKISPCINTLSFFFAIIMVRILGKMFCFTLLILKKKFVHSGEKKVQVRNKKKDCHG